MTQGINWEVKNLLGPTLFLTQILYKKTILMTSADTNIPPTAESYYWLYLGEYRVHAAPFLTGLSRSWGWCLNTSGHKSTLKPSLL